MKKATFLAALIGVFVLMNLHYGNAQVSAGVSISNEVLKGFYLSIGDHYKVPEREVIIVKEKGIPDEEIPVVFHIAQEAHVSPEAVVAFRLGGKSWIDIAFNYNLGADIFYVPVKRAPGPPYGKAYGYYKNKPKNQWKQIRLMDDDVINLVNLKFLSDHHGYSPDEIIKMRSGGKHFIFINDDIKKAKKVKIKDKRIRKRNEGA